MVRFGTSKYPTALEYLHRILERLGSRNTPIIVIENADDEMVSHHLDENTKVISGDNSLWEFSGWHRGINELVEFAPDTNMLLLVTDAFVNAEPRTKDDYCKQTKAIDLELSFDQNIVLGLLDPINFYRIHPSKRIQYRIAGWSFDHWMRTAFFLMPMNVYSSVIGRHKLHTFDNLDDFFPMHFNGKLFLEDADADKNWRDMLHSWLTQEWHSAGCLSKESWPLIRRKSLAILNEHALSCRIREAGVPIIDLRLLRWIEQKFSLIGQDQMSAKYPRRFASLLRSLFAPYLPLRDRYFLYIFLFRLLISKGND